MSVLDERQKQRKTYCHNYADRLNPQIVHYGCDQEIKWIRQDTPDGIKNVKCNVDGTPHYCTHSNETRSRANEAANNAAVLKAVESNVEQLAQANPPVSIQPAVFKKVSDFSPQDEFIIAVARMNTNLETLINLQMQTNELLKQLIKGAK